MKNLVANLTNLLDMNSNDHSEKEKELEEIIRLIESLSPQKKRELVKKLLQGDSEREGFIGIVTNGYINNNQISNADFNCKEIAAKLDAIADAIRSTLNINKSS